MPSFHVMQCAFIREICCVCFELYLQFILYCPHLSLHLQQQAKLLRSKVSPPPHPPLPHYLFVLLKFFSIISHYLFPPLPSPNMQCRKCGQKKRSAMHGTKRAIRFLHMQRVHVKSNSRDTQGRVKKLRAVKWTEGGEDRAQVPFRALLASKTSSNV